MNMSATATWKNLVFPVIKDRVYVLKDNGILELKEWIGDYVGRDVIRVGTKDNIPVIRYATVFDSLKKSMPR